MKFLIGFLSQLFNWLISLVQWAFEWVWQEILGALVTVLSAIPVPGWLSDAPNVLANIPSGVVFILGILQFQAGVTIMIGAWLLRFLIKRLPIIG
jgi:hypothetical protein